MRKRTALLVVVVCGLIGLSCQPQVQEVGPLSETDVASLRGTIDPYVQAMLANDWVAVAAFYSEDAVRMPPNQIMQQGRAAIQADLESSLGTVSDFGLKIAEIDGRDDIAYVRGSYKINVSMEGMTEPVSDNGKWLNISRKQPDGSWPIAISIWNSDQPLPGGGIVTKELKETE
jgi:ketosteroid isomerase-like protein